MDLPLRSHVLISVGAAIALLGCGSAQREAPPAEPRVVTIVQDDAELLHRPPERIAATLDDLQALGVDWVRVTAGWSAIEPERGAPRWAALDRLAGMARDRGLRLNVDIAFWAPRWAVARPDPDSERQREGIDMAAFAAFAGAVARRYRDAAAFTIWNEPNHPTFLLPQWQERDGRLVAAAPHAYREMLRAAVPAVERAAPDALVLIGATSSLGTSDPAAAGDRMAPLTFARELACVDERMRALDRPECRDFAPLPGDGWSHHPYGVGLRPSERDRDPDTARIGDLDRLERLLGQLADAGRTARRLPIYVTEYGYQSNPPDPTQPWSPEEQARLLSEGELAARLRPTVRAFAQFLVRDLPERPGATARDRWRDFQTGVRTADGAAKPAHAALAAGLVAVRAGTDRVRFWGIVRPGSGPRTVRITERRTYAYDARTLASFTTEADGTFTRTLRADPGATFRLHATVAGRRVSGAALSGARAP